MAHWQSQHNYSGPLARGSVTDWGSAGETVSSSSWLDARTSEVSHLPAWPRFAEVQPGCLPAPSYLGRGELEPDRALMTQHPARQPWTFKGAHEPHTSRFIAGLLQQRAALVKRQEAFQAATLESEHELKSQILLLQHELSDLNVQKITREEQMSAALQNINQALIEIHTASESNFTSDKSLSADDEPDFFDVVAASADEIVNESTSVLMIRNLPCRRTQDDIEQMVNELGFGDACSLLYIPSKRNRKGNLGYGFVGFNTSEDCMRFAEAIEGYHFQTTNGPKLVQVVPARIQTVKDGLALNPRAVSRGTSVDVRCLSLRC